MINRLESSVSVVKLHYRFEHKTGKILKLLIFSDGNSSTVNLYYFFSVLNGEKRWQTKILFYLFRY